MSNEQEVLNNIADAMKSGVSIVEAIEQFGGEEVKKEIKKSVAVKKGTDKQKFLISNNVGVVGALKEFEKSIRSIFDCSDTNAEDIKVDAVCSWNKEDGTTSGIIKVKMKEVKSPVIVLSSGEETTSEVFRDFGRKKR